MVVRNLLLKDFLRSFLNYSIKQCTRNIRLSLTNASSDIDDKFKLPSRYAGSEQSIWVEYLELFLKYKPLNLGHGFPDYCSQKLVVAALAEVANSDNDLIHQYTRGFGHPRTVTAIAKLYSKLIDRQINPDTEVLVTIGGYEALFSIISGHIDFGDEVIIIEPYFDCYEPMVRYAGGISRFIPLRRANKDSSTDWVLDKKELECLFNSKTKIIIVNTPHNPFGKVYKKEELAHVADLCKKWNVLCIVDEVYEWIVYEPNEHIRMATLPGMWERTITVGSIGKTFGVTGWKMGWAYGPANLMVNLQMVHQNCIYTGVAPIQEAAAIAFEKAMTNLNQKNCVFKSTSKELIVKRNYMAKILCDAGMEPLIPEGGYFMIADWTPLESQVDLSSEKDKFKDYRFTKWMIKNVGLGAIPPSAFFSQEHKYLGENFVRYCFFKKDENLQKTAEILKKWKTERNK
jgi:kynurenine--oxoglutarate transaminase/cysteine-S-conjugate beta-lyase/glutamine--phenylpyruvate transaminase